MDEDEMQALVREVADLAWDAVIYMADNPEDRRGAERLLGTFERRLTEVIGDLARPGGSS